MLKQNKFCFKKTVWLSIIGSLFFLDQGSKLLAQHFLKTNSEQPLVPGIKFMLTYNPGAAFSLLDKGLIWQKALLIITSASVSLFLLHWLLFKTPEKHYQKWTLIFLLSGALGNLWDRCCYGKVTDFIVLYYKNYYWPAFNVADSMITVSGFMMGFWIFESNQRTPA